MAISNIKQGGMHRHWEAKKWLERSEVYPFVFLQFQMVFTICLYFVAVQLEMCRKFPTRRYWQSVF